MPIFYTFIRYKSNKTKMKKKTLNNLTTLLLFISTAVLNSSVSAQQLPVASAKSEFWQKVQFGGGLGLGFGNGFTDITVAPSAIYNFNDYVSLGTGLQFSYISQKDFYNSTIVGASIIGLFNPIEEIQLSLEVEEMNVNTTFQSVGNTTLKDNFWNTGLFIGAGYRAENVTIGARYNLLYDKDKTVYGSALMPFVRVYF